MASEKAIIPASLEDRISKPEPAESETSQGESSKGTNVAAPSFVPGQKDSWADDTTSPIDANPKPAADTKTTAHESSLSTAQTDGASEDLGGSGLHEPAYSVNVKLSDKIKFDNDAKLSDIQSDPNNPLYSIKSFEDLNLDPVVLKGIYQMRFTRPSKIQEKALPLLLADPPINMIGQSQSGTGKTAAFVLNILSRLDLVNPGMVTTPQAICLAPTRELARQIMGVIQVMGMFLDNLEVQAAIPMDRADRGKKLVGQIIVGTPGTTTDLIRKGLLDVRKIKTLVLDEADNMLDQQGLGEQCIRVKMMLPKDIQVVLFSATFPNAVVKYAMKFAPDAHQITLHHEDLTVDGIKQLYLDCPSESSKFDILVKLYGLMTVGSSIIFVKTRDTAAEIERRMTAQGHQCVSLTGAFEGSQRDVIIDAFRDSKAKVLITTNVLARGIDVQSVSLVINYDVPDDNRGHADTQTYLHRIGRTGRFGRVGVAISFVYDTASWNMLMEIRDYFNVEITGVQTNDWDKVEEAIKKVIKSSRAGSNFSSVNENAM